MPFHFYFKSKLNVAQAIQKHFGLPKYQQLLFIIWCGVSTSAIFTLYQKGIFNNEYLGTGLSAFFVAIIIACFGAVIITSFTSPKQAHSLLFLLPIMLSFNIIQFKGNAIPYNVSLDTLVVNSLLTIICTLSWFIILLLERVLHG